MAPNEPTDRLRVVTINLQGEHFALETRHVREILDPGPTTLVPSAPAFLNRLINVRGRVVPLADLRLRLGFERSTLTIDTRVIVLEVELAEEPVTVAVLADKVNEVREITPVAPGQTPRFGLRCRPDHIRCIGQLGDDFVIVLDPAAIFASSAPRRAAEHATEPHLSC